MRWTTITALLAVGCEKDLLADIDDPADAQVDAFVPAGDFTCIGQPLMTTAPDPIRFAGTLNDGDGNLVDGATIEIHSLADDSLLAPQTTTGAIGTAGAYEVDVATSGIAPTTYRKATKDGFLDSYLIDAFPVWFSPAGIGHSIFTDAHLARYYQAAGVTPDPSKATVAIVANDCPDTVGITRVVAGATISVSGAEKVMYLDETRLGVDPTASATTAGGTAIAFNAPTGSLEVTVVAGPYTYRVWPPFGRAGALVIAPVTP